MLYIIFLGIFMRISHLMTVTFCLPPFRVEYQCKFLGFWSSLHLFICPRLVLTGGCLASVWGYHPALSYIATSVLTVPFIPPLMDWLIP